MGRRGGVLTAHGDKGRNGGILTGHGQRALIGILTVQGQGRCIDMTCAGKVGFSLVMGRRDGVLIGHGEERWCTESAQAQSGVQIIISLVIIAL